MALYVPAGARTRRLVLVGAAALVVGVVLGYVLGRASAPTFADQVADVQELATAAATALERLPIEYEQLLDGGGGESADTLIDALDSARSQLADAYAAAIWLADDAPSATEEAFDSLLVAVSDSVPAAVFADAIDQAVTRIKATFGIDAGPGG